MTDFNRRKLLKSSLLSLFTLSSGLPFAKSSLYATELKQAPKIDISNTKKFDYLLNQDELHIGYPSQDQFPFFYKKNDETIGMDVDLASRFASSLNLKLNIDRTAQNSTEVVNMVADKKLDLAFYITPTVSRILRVSFSNPYAIFSQSLLVNRVEFAKISSGSSPELTIQNYHGSIAVTEGSVWEELARRNFPNATVVKFKTWEQGIQAVTEGKVICAYRNEFFVRKILKANPSLALVLRAISFNDLFDYESIAVHRDNKILLELLNHFVAQKSGQLNINALLDKI